MSYIYKQKEIEVMWPFNFNISVEFHLSTNIENQI